ASSQSPTGDGAGAQSGIPISSTRACSFGDVVPADASPATSPFTSAMNTGTPRREKPSARVIRVTVLPVPVAPATRPWRFAYAGSRRTAVPLPDLPTRIGSMRVPFSEVGAIVKPWSGFWIPLQVMDNGGHENAAFTCFAGSNRSVATLTCGNTPELHSAMTNTTLQGRRAPLLF